MSAVTASLAVTAPLPGRVVALADVPDPVFAGLVVGAGLAVEPPDGATATVAVAPVAGRIATVHPHAFVVVADETSGAGVLVHLGIDTVQLHGAGFTVHVAAGDTVAAGTPVITFDPTAVRASGRSAVCPVVVFSATAQDIGADAVTGADVAAGDPLFTWAARPAP